MTEDEPDRAGGQARDGAERHAGADAPGEGAAGIGASGIGVAALGDPGRVEAALSAWRREARLADFLAAPGAAYLVLDCEKGRVVHASAAATPLAEAITDAQGFLIRAQRLAEQVRQAQARDGGIRLARLRLDPRRIAPPTTCMLTARTGSALVLLALVEPSPVGRGRGEARAPDPSEPDGEPHPGFGSQRQGPAAPERQGPAAPERQQPASVLAQPAPQPGDRFLWQSDGADNLVHVSDPALARALRGGSWLDHATSGRLREAEYLIAALDAGVTFRGISARLCLEADGPLPVLDLVLSGTPLARPGHPYAGFSGFGVVAAGERSAARPVPEPVPAEPLRPEPPGLSRNEHDAFREIARALGVRYAGDETDEAPRAGGAVTPFRFQRGEEQRGDETSRQASAALLDALPTGIVIHRGDSLVFANRRLLDLAGYADPEALLAAGGLRGLFGGQPLPTVASGPEVEPTAAALSTRAGGVRPVEALSGMIDWDGARATVLLVRPARGGDDALRELAAARVVQSFRDAHAADARALLDALEDGLVTLDADGRVLAVNRSAGAIFGSDPREIVGGPFVALFPAKEAALVQAALRGGRAGAPVSALGREAAGRYDLRIAALGADGRRVAVLRAQAADAAEADPGGRRQQSAQAADILARLSHEVRTPMNGILGFADLMLNERLGPVANARYRDYLRDIHACGEQVLGLVNDMRDLVRIEAGAGDLVFAPVALDDLAASCVALLQPQAARSRIVIRTSFGPDLPALQADERTIRQAALNIIANALQFTPAGGQVIVSATADERGALALRVRDTGIGMSPEEVEAALDPFRRAAASGPRRGGGGGFGLPLTRALVEANDGRFRIVSRKSEGTLVEMLFPGPRVALRA